VRSSQLLPSVVGFRRSIGRFRDLVVFFSVYTLQGRRRLSFLF
jgi:hypothetical protein